MPSRTFDVDLLMEWEIGFVHEWQDEGWETRWNKHQNTVFRAEDDGKLYQFVFRTGLTEMQECYGEERYEGADYDRDTKTWVLTCPEVELYTEMQPVTKWRKVA